MAGDDDGALRMVQESLADGTEEQAGEPAPATSTHHKKLGVGAGLHERRAHPADDGHTTHRDMSVFVRGGCQH